MGSTRPEHRGVMGQCRSPVLLLFALAILLLSCLSLVCPAAGSGPKANTLYVGFGSDSYAGLQEAIDAASGGDTILVAPGLYNTSAKVDKALTIKAADEGSPILQPSSSAPMLEVESEGVTITGLTFSGIKRTGSAISAKSSPDLRIEDCVFMECVSAIAIRECPRASLQGITVWFGTKGIEARDCDNVSLSEVSVSYTRDGVNLVGCVWSHVRQTNVSYGDGYGYRFARSNYCTLENSSAYQCPQGLAMQGPVSRASVSHSVFKACGTGIWLYDNATYNKIYLNEISWCTGTGMRLTGCTNNTIIWNNFMNNIVQAYDDLNNTWGYKKHGNYWSDQNRTDAGLNGAKKNDGICDIPYNITGGNNSDAFSWMNALDIQWIPGYTPPFKLTLGDLVLSVPSLVAGVLSAVLGLYVLTRNRRAGSNRVFFLLMLGCMLWGFGEFMHRLTNPDTWGAFWFLFSNVGLICIPPFLFHFTFVYPEDVLTDRTKRLMFTVLYIPAFLLIIGMIVLQDAWFGLLIQFVIIYFLLFVILALVRIILIYLKAKEDLTKAQAIYLIIGLLIILFLISMELILGSLPSVDWFVVVADSLLILFIASFFAVAVLRYRLVDVEIIFKKSAFYSLMSLFLGGIFVTFENTMQYVMGMLGNYIAVLGELPPLVYGLLAAFAVVAAFAPLRTGIKFGLDRVFPQSRKFEKEYIERLGAYEQTLEGMWSDNKLTDKETEALRTLRKSLNLTDKDHEDIEKHILERKRGKRRA